MKNPHTTGRPEADPLWARPRPVPVPQIPLINSQAHESWVCEKQHSIFFLSVSTPGSLLSQSHCAVIKPGPWLNLQKAIPLFYSDGKMRRRENSLSENSLAHFILKNKFPDKKQFWLKVQAKLFVTACGPTPTWNSAHFSFQANLATRQTAWWEGFPSKLCFRVSPV